LVAGFDLTSPSGLSGLSDAFNLRAENCQRYICVTVYRGRVKKITKFTKSTYRGFVACRSILMCNSRLPKSSMLPYCCSTSTRRQHRHAHQPLAASEGTRNEATRPSAVLRLRSRRGLALLEAVQAARATPAAAVAVPAIWPGAAMSRCFGVWQHTERSDLASERGSRRRFVAKCDTSQSQSHKILHLAATVGPTSHTVRACPASFSCLRARRESPARGLLVKSNVYPTSSCMGWPQLAGVFRQPCCGSASRA
jgi:hypothetical protein